MTVPRRLSCRPGRVDPLLNAIAHTVRELTIAGHRGVLVAEDDTDIGVAATAHQLCECCALLGEDRQPRVTEIVEPESRPEVSDTISSIRPHVSPSGVRQRDAATDVGGDQWRFGGSSQLRV